MTSQTDLRLLLRPSTNARQTIGVVGDAWTLRILRAMFRGTRRYSDFLRTLGVSRAVLTDRLQRLEAADVVARHATPASHPEYRLTECGLDLWRLYLAMWLWQYDWEQKLCPSLRPDDVPRTVLRHSVCGHSIRPSYRCAVCGLEIHASETRVVATSAITTAGPSNGADDVPTPNAMFRKPRSQGTVDRAEPVLMQIIGDRWNCAVVGAAFRGAKLFSEFELALDIRPNQLTDRLFELQRLGILRARAYAGSRNEYRLTRAGIALFPITLELMRWGGRWLAPRHPATFTVQHTCCGSALTARWHCDHCDGLLERQETRFDPMI